jgi:hypothetical protein
MVWFLGNWRFSFIFSILVLVAALACSSSVTPTPPPGGPGGVSVIIVTTDLAVGTNRVVFGLVDLDGMAVRSKEAQVRAIYLPPAQAVGEVKAAATARFTRWPVGEQGVFATRLEFDRAGFWGLEVTVARADGTSVVARGAFEVKQVSATPAIGAAAPRSVNLTARDVPDLSALTSANPPDPDLYRLSIAEALDSGKPLVVVFATPAFCVSATCGPQVEVISAVKERHREQANFIHVEVFANPQEIKGGRPAGGFVPAVAEWGLPTEPWTFIVDKEGKVRAKFEQFTTEEEIEAALAEVL